MFIYEIGKVNLSNYNHFSESHVPVTMYQLLK